MPHVDCYTWAMFTDKLINIKGEVESEAYLCHWESSLGPWQILSVNRREEVEGAR